MFSFAQATAPVAAGPPPRFARRNAETLIGVSGISSNSKTLSAQVQPRQITRRPTSLITNPQSHACQCFGGRARTAASFTSMPQPGPVGSTSSPSSIFGTDV